MKHLGLAALAVLINVGCASTFENMFEPLDKAYARQDREEAEARAAAVAPVKQALKLYRDCMNLAGAKYATSKETPRDIAAAAQGACGGPFASYEQEAVRFAADGISSKYVLHAMEVGKRNAMETREELSNRVIQAVIEIRSDRASASASTSKSGTPQLWPEEI
jgi:hypothetical protein